MGLLRYIAETCKQRSKKAINRSAELAGKISANADIPILKKLLALGADLSTKSGMKIALEILGEKPSRAEDLYIELKNNLNHEGFRKIPYEKRALFLPQCLRCAEKCKAELTEVGYICKECGACCAAYKLKKAAEELGYKAFIVPGGSMVMKILANNYVEGIVGVGCRFELCEAVEKLSATKLWIQGIPLLKDGCKNTTVDIERVLDTIKMH